MAESPGSGFYLIRKFWNFFAGSVCLVLLFFVLVSFGLFGELPDIKELENPRSSLSTEVYSEDGEILGKYFLENRTNIRHSDIAECVYDALIATEDIRFTEHSGIDLRGTARAVASLGRDGGASTISQQLAKNMFSRFEKPRMKITRIMQKCKEWIIAIRLERRYTKDEIITMYLNTVPFSGMSFGIDAASHEFFNKKPKDLKVDEAAVLVGMLKANSAYNPKLNPERSRQRRNVVLSQMVKYNKLSSEDFEKIKDNKIVLHYVSVDNEGPAIYFRDYMARYLDGWCKKNGYNLYKSGLKIYTTLNSRMQKYAEDAVAKHMKELQKQFTQSWGKEAPWRRISDWSIVPNFIENALHQTDRYKILKEKLGSDEKAIMAELKKPVPMTIFSWNGDRDTVMSPYDSMKYIKKFLHAGFIAVEPETGNVKAWVGGINHRHFKYDHVNINARRQVGSTFKPLVYATAMDINKTSPCTRFPRERTTFKGANGEPWSPHNADYSEGGTMTMAQGLANSDNLITAQIMKSLGDEAPQMVIKFAERVGIEKGRIEPVPAICLGAVELSPFEMASAYTAFVNKGLWVEPNFITRIEDKKGNVLEEFNEPRHDQVLSEEKAYMMFKMLLGVVDFGTGSYLKGKFGVRGSIGGKTGTTQGSADGWFMGVTKNLVCATWVGADDPSVRFRNAWLGQGALMALPIYGYFFSKASADKTLGLSTDMPDLPKNPGSISVDCGDDPDDTVESGKDLNVDGLGQ
ncbi:MAG: transglycosylase domain-containing protein [Bacteroidetes bacterium]|nr:transglycosylase domain-containing protein [Bacteroidota bacterium]